jgi:hypothetical protein
MNVNEFNQLDELKKLDYIWNKSALVKDLSFPGYKLIYYQVEDFFVEAHYDLFTESITEIKGIVELPLS